MAGHRVVVVSDVRIVRDGLADAIERRRQGGATESCPSLAAAAERATDLAVSVLVLDMSMPGALTFAREFTQRRPDVHVVAFAVSDADPALIACVEAGITGFVPRDGSIDLLFATLSAIERGEALVSPRLAATLMRRLVYLGRDAEPTKAIQLTRREQEILSLIDRGLSNKQIAHRLSIELPTVKNHVHNILEKMRVRRRGEAAAAFRGLQLA